MGTWRIMTAAAYLATLSLASCKDTPTATITITTGEEHDAFSRAPTPTRLIVESVHPDGNVTELSRASLPVDEVSLGDKPRTEVGAFRVTATDDVGKVLLKGESLLVQFGALESASLEVFAQRTGEFARLPRAPVALDAPRVGVTLGRYLFAASGTNGILYDLLLLKPAGALPALPRPATSLATFGTAAILIDIHGATAYDFTTGLSSDLAAPSGGTFANVAGGSAVEAGDGSIVVVGGTRPSGGATTGVFVISPEGGARFGALTTPREGACATWVEGRGVFVYGGTDADSAGELLGIGAAIGTTLPLPRDPVRGCGATPLDGSHVLVVGGVGSVSGTSQARVIDLACTTTCAPAEWRGALPLVRAEAFALAANAALVVGDDSTGASHAYRITPEGAAEVPLRMPRRGARLVALPVKGAVAVIGGAPGIEQYVE